MTVSRCAAPRCSLICHILIILSNFLVHDETDKHTYVSLFGVVTLYICGNIHIIYYNIIYTRIIGD